MLETRGGDLTAIQQQHSVIQQAFVAPGYGEQQSRTAVACLRRQFRHRARHRILKGPFQNKVLRRIAAQHQFAKDNQIRAQSGGLPASVAHQFRIARDIADHRVDLRQGDLQCIHHGPLFRTNNVNSQRRNYLK